MQFDPQRAFPHPVLRPGVNDYIDGDFQSVVEFVPSKTRPQITLEIQFSLSVSDILKLISRGAAKYVAVVVCRDTYLRRAFATSEPSLKVVLDSGDLGGEVQVFPYVIAQKEVRAYKSALINREFGKGPFTFGRGAVIAVDEPKAIYVDRDMFKPITSIFDLVKNENLRGAEWRLNFSAERIRISVAPAMKEKIDKFRHSPKNKAILINSIYFAAVMQALKNINNDEYAERKWVQIIRSQCHNKNLNLETGEEYLIAEQLLNFPLGLFEAYVFEDSSQ